MLEFRGLREKTEKTQHALYNQLGFGSTTLLQLDFLGEKRLEKRELPCTMRRPTCAVDQARLRVFSRLQIVQDASHL